MKAFVAPRAGILDTLKLMEIPVPEIGADEVLVQIRTVGVGVHDRWFMPQEVRYPYPIGIEAAGIIDAVGEAVTRFAVGDRVMFVSSMQPKGGVWAEFAAVAETTLIRIPDELDFVRAAALPVAGGTALRSMHLLDLGAGDALFMAGASGAIGTLAIQLARSRGIRVAASASERNHDYLRSLGAELAVDYRDPEWVEQVRAWSQTGVDAALAIQPGTSADSMRLVRDGGTLVTVSGDRLAPERGIRISVLMGATDARDEMAELAAEVASGRIHVEVEQVYPFEDGIQALEKTETRRARGKVVLTLE